MQNGTRKVHAVVLIKEQIIFAENLKKEEVETELWTMLIDMKKTNL